MERPILHTIITRLSQKRRFIEVLSGPRQVGKTTLAFEAAEALALPFHYASADEPSVRDTTWIKQQWEIARLKCGTDGLLILDEVQKIFDWSNAVKLLWDEDTHNKLPLKVMILGSSPLLMQQGLTESLAGRFEIIPITHWSFAEMREAFGWNLNQYIYFGGYPGAAPLIEDEERWKRYILDSLIEPTISRDILLVTRVDKPVLLRRLFQLGAQYSGQILSFQKMLGQLLDAGNTTTLAHYLELLGGAGMLSGISKYAGETVRQRGSSPKLQVHNTALMTAQLSTSFQDTLHDRQLWGRLVESAVGAYLINQARGTSLQIFYWRDSNKEVDFVLKSGKSVIALEVKSGQNKGVLPGMQAFEYAFHPDKLIQIGGQGLDLETFFSMPIQALFK